LTRQSRTWQTATTEKQEEREGKGGKEEVEKVQEGQEGNRQKIPGKYKSGEKIEKIQKWQKMSKVAKSAQEWYRNKGQTNKCNSNPSYPVLSLSLHLSVLRVTHRQHVWKKKRALQRKKHQKK